MPPKVYGGRVYVLNNGFHQLIILNVLSLFITIIQDHSLVTQ
ncbi:hypothetical protein DDB_G0273507 [Dictyostelium discoideum AX4]|uniref:Uncharacterized protein n=1 Tax=Dictyostelium discoideum TaxID=44689 RepID=Q557K1_DICDI|nr:hypothetical protein DDB_G0273461 [Dictyostelium discoideum AX4]XP_644634.1 hypothetical protein DDB_G0273507 [Dictyostelium discoideum AX4]EAL70685.1 hypothetical protein DDB_G0273461 [Dictyostelium discoideum AX4]EAL70708.1 hypothetical protein DDB_G0273507 [Dictyostelium discoideum AX4]|eukprot:XP_644616.1 hypothetical protein DDB_G0273461 [Dictyostelium discoideum AX4]